MCKVTLIVLITVLFMRLFPVGRFDENLYVAHLIAACFLAINRAMLSGNVCNYNSFVQMAFNAYQHLSI
jgi:hypothetical protein